MSTVNVVTNDKLLLSPTFSRHVPLVGGTHAVPHCPAATATPPPPFLAPPVEIISRIIEIGAQDSKAGGNARFALFLSHTCTRLRDIVLSTPLLWTDIEFVGGKTHPGAYDEIAARLQRSSTVPIDVAASNITTKEDAEIFLRLVYPHVKRWRSFDLSVLDDAHVAVTLMENLVEEAPILERINLSGPGVRVFSPFGGRAPNLRHLATRSMPLKWDGPITQPQSIPTHNSLRHPSTRLSTIMNDQGAGFTALESCLQTLEHLFIDMQRLKFEAGYEEKRGGYGDVRVATLDSNSPTSKLVAAKTIRLKAPYKEPHRLAFRLARELKVWAGLQHPHVLPLLGYYLDKDYKLAVLISEYMIHCDLKDYIREGKPSLDLRLHIVRDLTDGLAHLHRQKPPISHADLKPGNVLINADRRAMLADFGLSRALEDAPSGLTTSEGLKGTLRYYSPELMNEQDASHSLASDMWAWGCLVMEVLADRIPYAERNADRLVMVAIVKKVLPAEIESLPIPIPEIKLLLAKCWAIQPSERPSASYCLRILNSEVYASPTPDHAEGSTSVQDSIPDQ